MPVWILFSFGSAVFAALVAIFAKVGLGGVSATLATTVRSLIMSGILVIAGFAFGTFRHVKWGVLRGVNGCFCFWRGLRVRFRGSVILLLLKLEVL